MGRPPTIRDETIIQAAREVFLARGIRATTAEVAERAGVSEGSIFHRFKSKPDLFAAAMRAQLDEPAWARTLERRAGTGDLRETLIDVGREVIAFYRTILPLFMMTWSNPPIDAVGGACPMSGARPPPLRSLRRITAFFEHEAAAGRIGPCNADVLARAFLGGLHNYVFLELVLDAEDARDPRSTRRASIDPEILPRPLDAEAFVREHVRLLWEGIRPREGHAFAGGAADRDGPVGVLA
ncbi:MAG TPA: helix-turn-helix domain-containing protein [Minicystis sp.]|nr:helix-turn-helix domain-containing protein [Minicystis sp.]